MTFVIVKELDGNECFVNLETVNVITPNREAEGDIYHGLITFYWKDTESCCQALFRSNEDFDNFMQKHILPLASKGER